MLVTNSWQLEAPELVYSECDYSLSFCKYLECLGYGWVQLLLLVNELLLVIENWNTVFPGEFVCHGAQEVNMQLCDDTIILYASADTGNRH